MFARLLLTGASLALTLAACGGGSSPSVSSPPAASASQLADGKQTFRFNTFGDEAFWTGTLQMNQVVQTSVDPTTALSVGLKVDADSLPPSLIQAILAGQVDMQSPATTVALLKLNAVVGLQATVDANGTVTQLGITCALCHSTVDNRVAKGIGSRLDGWPNRDLNPGAIIALSPAVDATQKAVYHSWGAGKFDPRFNIDGKSTPVVIPPAYGLAGVNLATYTGDGPVSYWNEYVAVTQMHGQGNFSDPRINVNVQASGPDRVTPAIPNLVAYELSLPKPPPQGTVDPNAVARGQQVFAGAGRCIQCHAGPTFTDANVRLHDPSETGADPAWAARSATKKYRTTPLRALASHAPYFHDGSAATLDAVVQHYNTTLGLALTPQQQQDLVAYLQTL
jgi:mono/diheme cytochrome c family protein